MATRLCFLPLLRLSGAALSEERKNGEVSSGLFVGKG